MIDAIQTAGILVTALGLMYVISLARRELRQASSALREVLATQNQITQNVRRIWERIDAIETRNGIQGDVETFIRMKRLLNAIDEPRPPPSPPHPPAP